MKLVVDVSRSGNRAFDGVVDSPSAGDFVIGRSPEMAAVMRTVEVVAVTDATVLLTGETGTGKELLAQAIHRLSRRSRRPFVAVNCAALPESLVESELFGSRRGAFTGAVADRPGRIQAAEGGTLLLDEIGELPLAAQGKLLRFLETGEVQAVGQAGTRTLRVRIIAATNRDLAGEVEAGRFREDLYYRLNVVPVELPPLRARSEDIPMLIEHFVARQAAAYGCQPPAFTGAAMRRLVGYAWPGNVRELRNLCERMVILHGGGTVDVGDLPRELLQGAFGRSERPASRVSLPDGGVVLEEVERELIGQALARTGGNRSQAARLLGLSRDTLLYRIKKHAIVA